MQTINVSHETLGACQLEIASPTSAVLIVDGQRMQATDRQAGRGYLHGDRSAMTTDQLAALDDYIVATTCLPYESRWDQSGRSLCFNFIGASLKTADQLARVEAQVGRIALNG